MKVRTDFVTNSSSSSFILRFNSRLTSLKNVKSEIHRLISNNDRDDIAVVLGHIDNESILDTDQKMEDTLRAIASWIVLDKYNTSKDNIHDEIENELLKLKNTVAKNNYKTLVHIESYDRLSGQVIHEALMGINNLVCRYEE